MFYPDNHNLIQRAECKMSSRGLVRQVTQQQNTRNVRARRSYGGRLTGIRKVSVPRSIYSPSMYHFKRSVSTKLSMNSSTGFTSGASDYGIGINFQLDKVSMNGPSVSTTVPSIAELTSLFDLYRIDKVVVKFIWSANSNIAANSGTGAPVLWVCNDHSDSTRPTGPDVIQQKQGAKCIQLGIGAGGTSNVHTHTCYPKVAQAVFQSGTFSGYAENSSKNVFISTQYVAVEHYGVKVRWDPFRTVNADLGDLMIVCDYYISFKGVQ